MSDMVANSTTVHKLPQLEELENRILELQNSLQKNLPNYDSQLFTIHQALKRDPDMAQMLSEEQIGIIVAGLTRKSGIVIASTSVKSSAGGARKKFTMEDI